MRSSLTKKLTRRADLSRRSLTQAEVKRRWNSGTPSANGGVAYPYIRLLAHLLDKYLKMPMPDKNIKYH
jgi:hypothetical protein